MIVRPLVKRSAILDASGRPIQRDADSPDRLSAMDRTGRVARTGLDAAADSRHTSNHFANADGRPLANVLTDDAATVRDRLRYEVPNNGDATGILTTLVNSVVGVGPTLQVHTDIPALDKLIETEWAAWADDCDADRPRVSLGDQLSLDLREQSLAGEDFCTFATAAASEHPVSLRMQAIAAERVATPWNQVTNTRIKDGIEYDANNRPIRYHVSRAHPKDTSLQALSSFGKFDAVDAADMLHDYIAQQPGQHRGMPWLTPTLTEMAATRRFVAAVLSAAETAADLTFVIETSVSELEEFTAVAPMDTVTIERNTGLTLPAGWKASQFKPEQPAATHADYVRERIRSMARPLLMPYNIAAGDSSRHNFASGRLDHQMFHLFILTTRHWQTRRKLGPVLARWLAEARLVYPDLRRLSQTDIRRIVQTAEFHFRSQTVHGDPLKEEKAITESLANGSTTIIDVCAAKGLDWETQEKKRHKVNLLRLELAAELKKKAKELELTDAEAAAALAGPSSGVDTDASIDLDDQVEEAIDEGKTDEKTAVA